MIRVIAFLLLAESLLTASRLTALLPSIAVYDGVALLLIVLRGLLAPLQFAGGWFVASKRPQGRPLAVAALAVGADYGLMQADPGLFYFYAVVKPGEKVDAVEEAGRGSHWTTFLAGPRA